MNPYQPPVETGKVVPLKIAVLVWSIIILMLPVFTVWIVGVFLHRSSEKIIDVVFTWVEDSLL